MIWPLITLLAIGGSGDPRVGIVAAQLAGDEREALALTDALLASDPERARDLGLDYLRGDLLERIGRHREADRAFAAAMSEVPELAAHSRFRLAVNQQRRGHPEVAAGLVASLLAANPPTELVDESARLLANALARGGDCRLLRNRSEWGLRGEARRLLEVSAVDCSLTTLPEQESVARLLRLLEETVFDEAARVAAERLHALFSHRISTQRDLIHLGRVFYHQRLFAEAVPYLRRGLAAPEDGSQTAESDHEARYALARSHFWLADYLAAAGEFGRVATKGREAERVADALYQQGRSYELNNSLEAATSSFRQAYLADTNGRWSGPALTSIMRLAWLTGREQEALATFEVLGSRSSWKELHGRAALFLASSDLAQDRPDRATSWIEKARGERSALGAALPFWTARLEELRRRPERAARLYAELIADSPFSPFSQLARGRLSRAQLASSAGRLALELASRDDSRSLHLAWALLDGTGEREELLERASARLHRSTAAGPFLNLTFVEPESWPMWQEPTREAAEILAGIGLWDEGLEATLRYFPASSVSLGYTGSRLLGRSGDHKSALLQAEVLYEGALVALPEPLVPIPLRRAAFPLPFADLISDAAANFDIDPFLLAALIREESRFDPDAVSRVTARGLTQFVLPTARRLARQAGLERVDPEDLHRPAVAITLGAVYLEELLARFEGREHQAVAAYNAGENQAELWYRYCLTEDPAEYLTKVGFRETRTYIEKVLSTRLHYRALYPPEALKSN